MPCHLRTWAATKLYLRKCRYYTACLTQQYIPNSLLCSTVNLRDFACHNLYCIQYILYTVHTVYSTYCMQYILCRVYYIHCNWKYTAQFIMYLALCTHFTSNNLQFTLLLSWHAKLTSICIPTFSVLLERAI